MCCRGLLCVAVCCYVLPCVAMCCRVLLCVALGCYVLPCVAMSLGVMGRDETCRDNGKNTAAIDDCEILCHIFHMRYTIWKM